MMHFTILLISLCKAQVPAPGDPVMAMSCIEDTFYRNDYDGDHNVEKTDSFFNGVYSIHDGWFEDRKFKWRYCKPSSSSIGPFSGDKSSALINTAYDEQWTRSCRDFNGGHAAIHAIHSWHDNHHEDRRYSIKCGALDLSKHRLTNCAWTSQLNAYDGVLDYDCAADKVIRSIWSQHSGWHEDRVFRFECCSVAPNTYTFNNIVGGWESMHSCVGCSSTEYTKEFGTESSTTTSIEDSYSTELSATVSAGFEMQTGPSATVEVTGTISQSVSKSMESSFTTSHSESSTFSCEKTYLFQWIVSGDEARSDGESGTFYVYSDDYLCTDYANPQCPPGYCSTSDCQQCK